MKNLTKSKIFISTFLLTYCLFFVITIAVIDVKSAGFGAGHLIYGFPFGYYYSHCFGGNYLWDGLIGNILFATVLGIAVGLVSSHFWINVFPALRLKILSPEFREEWAEFRAKWHL